MARWRIGPEAWFVKNSNVPTGVLAPGGDMRNWSKISVLASVLATTFVMVPTAAEASPAKPVVVSFTATPPLFYMSGGPVSLTAQIANASTCTFTSNKVLPGLPAVVD